jgi:zinc protease
MLLLMLPVFWCSEPALAQKAVPLPELQSKRLLNDLHITVASVPNAGDDMTIGLAVRYGAAFDPADKGGLANLVSQMFMRATIDKTAKAIQEELALLGATLEITCDWDGFRFVLDAPGSGHERSLLLLYQVVAEAQFTEADFKTVKESILQGILKPSEDPRQRIRRQLDSVLFSGTTYGRFIQGDPKSVSSITLGDVRAFYRKFFSPGKAALMVVGNLESSQVIQRATRIWGIWVENEDVPYTFLPPRKPAGRQIFLEDDPNSPAAQFIIGSLFPRREDPAYSSALLAARIFQERLTKILPTSLLTVGYEGRRMSSPFFVQGQAAADQAADQLQRIRAAADELKAAPASKEELESARQKVIEDFNRELTAPKGICKIMMHAEIYRLGSNYAAVFPDQIRRCDVEALKEAANNWIFPGGEFILVRGPASELKPALESLGPIRQLAP